MKKPLDVRTSEHGVANPGLAPVKGSAKHKALAKRARGNYAIFRHEEGKEPERLKHNLSHKDMHHELRNNPEYRGTDKHGFSGRRTYMKKK